MLKRASLFAAASAALIGVGLVAQPWAIAPVAAAVETTARVPAPVLDPPSTERQATAIVAGGCFWGVQGVFQHVRGVTSAVSGYAGGARGTAQYETVSGGNTGHAESVRITYDPRVVSYGTLLRIFFAVVHDPTQLNYQGPDHGTQYRSAIFPTTPAQAQVAQAYIAQLGRARVWSRPIVTRIEAGRAFFPAEAYHQDYLTLNPGAAYIRFNDIPKVEALQREFPASWRAAPVLVNRRG